MMLDQITPLILTYNEAPNLERTLGQLRWANDIVVVDSFSDDETATIAASFPQARVFQRRFDNHRDQWTFALKETGIKTAWILALDADYVLTDDLVSEFETLSPGPSLSGYSAEFIYCLNGKPLRSGIYPSVTVLYRSDLAVYEQDGHTHRVRINGNIAPLTAKILHDDRKSLRRWLQSQASYAELEARKLLAQRSENLSVGDRIRKLRLVAPAAVLFYCLVLRGGILDGWAGLFYAFQRALAELLLSLHLIDATLRNKPASIAIFRRNRNMKREVEGSR